MFNNQNLLRMMDNALAHQSSRNLSTLYILVDFNNSTEIGSTAPPRAKRLNHGKMRLIQVLDLEGNLL